MMMTRGMGHWVGQIRRQETEQSNASSLHHCSILPPAVFGVFNSSA